MIQYKNSLEDASLLKNFLLPYALREKKYISRKRGIPEDSAEDIARKVDFPEVNKSNYIEYFNKYNDKSRIVILFNTINKLKISVKQYLIEAHGFFLPVFFNCKEDKDFCRRTFGVEKFPSIKIYNRNSLN